MDFSNDLEHNFDDFKRMITQLDDIDHKIEDETQTIIVKFSIL